MAIGCVHTEWMYRLAKIGALTNRVQLLDLGPQDIQVKRDWLAECASYHSNSKELPNGFDPIFEGEDPRKDCQLDYYGLFGIKHYLSTDLDDSRATYKLDLNEVAATLPKCDVVTNFGTAEHVFNIGHVFETMHLALKPGGLSLHVVPAFGFVNHGFYTPNPNLFIEFARANHYSVVDFSYIDNMFVRERWRSKNLNKRMNFDALEITLKDMEDTQLFMTKVVNRFLDNADSEVTRKILGDLSEKRKWWQSKIRPKHMCFLFDLVFIALQKPAVEMAMKMPIQRMEGVLPLPKLAL